MKRNILAVALIALSSATLADVTKWTAAMQEDEGGEVMVAWIDGVGAAGDTIPPSLRLMCFDQVSVRYDAGILPDGAYMMPGDEADLVFRSDKGELTRHALYEDMDGALAVYVPKDDAVIELLRSGATLSLTVVGHDAIPARDFALNGSSAALDTLFKTCP